MRRGFTLVELAIVLVIIGLLIGGILAAQSMIAAARVTRVVREVAQYQVAGDLFMATYKEVPGDCARCVAMFGAGGDGDGKIIGGAEELYVWVDLQRAGMLPAPVSGAYTGTGYARGDGITSPAGYSVPMITSLGSNADTILAYWLDNSAAARDAEKAIVTGTYLVLQHESTNSNDIATITAEMTQAIDSKIDDGNPVLGKVNAQLATWGPGHAAYFQCWTPEFPFNTSPSDVKYNITGAGYCQPQFKAWDQN